MCVACVLPVWRCSAETTWPCEAGCVPSTPYQMPSRLPNMSFLHLEFPVAGPFSLKLAAHSQTTIWGKRMHVIGKAHMPHMPAFLILRWQTVFWQSPSSLARVRCPIWVPHQMDHVDTFWIILVHVIYPYLSCIPKFDTQSRPARHCMETVPMKFETPQAKQLYQGLPK